MSLRLVFVIAFLGSFILGFSQSWNLVDADNIEPKGIKDISPQVSTIYNIDDDEMHSLLWSAEKEANRNVHESTQIINVGLPNGQLDAFRIVQYEMMEAEIASKYNDIRTYYGVSTTNTSRRIRIDYTYHGFRAVILQPGEDKIFIDHYQRNDKNTRVVYYKKDYKKVPSWGCNVMDDHNVDRNEISGSRIGDCQLRSYRLAQATTAEYSNFHGAMNSSQSGLVMSAVTTAINRINEVYEPEVAVRLILVNNTDQIFYYTASTDPYTNNNGSTMLNENITTCNNVIGSANYDIGHVFSTGGGGVAFLGSVCGSSKAGGVTGQPSPVGDPFTIDYVAHEMGHQFGGSHTQYNNCNRSNASAMEPGSASTIMGYAGICSPNVQNNSDAYFHARSIDQIKNFLTGNGNSCSTIVPLPTNNPPVISAVNNFSIPISTPFILTLDATDPENHSMTYAWEQMNSFVSPAQTMPPASTNSTGPMFRSIFATTTPNRYFPPLANVINNTANTWEVLPSVARTMNFRGVVRDFTGVFGCNNEVNITVSTVNASAGSFSITSFNTPTSWIAGDNKTVTWNVAGSSSAPINASNVDILFSIDGGNTFPITLASATPNDGSQVIVVPSNATSTGRIMLKATNHIFYDISDGNISISGVPSTYTLSASPSSFSSCPFTTLTSTIDVIPTGGFTSPVTLSISGLPSGSNGTFSVNPVLPGSNSILTITGLNNFGNYNIVINGDGGSQIKSTQISVSIQPLPPLVSLLSPVNMATNISLTPTMTWAMQSGALSYDFEVAYDSGFDEMISVYNGSATSYTIVNPILGGTTLYWRVRANNSCGQGDWSTRSFTVEPCYFYNPSSLPLNIPSGMDPMFSYLNIEDKGTVTDINVLNLEGSGFQEIVALKFSLISPQNSFSDFWVNPCRKENTFDIQFDDTAASPYPCPPNTGLTYQPTNPLSVLNNQPLLGNWALKIERGIVLSGDINNWRIKACVNNFCRLEVEHTRRSGPGSLHQAIDCASSGDVIRFADHITNDTIFLGDQSLLINKELYIEAELSDNIHIMSESISATISNSAPISGNGLKIKGLHIHSANAGIGAINNTGKLVLENVVLHKWPNSSTSTITNHNGSIANLIGNCQIVD